MNHARRASTHGAATWTICCITTLFLVNARPVFAALANPTLTGRASTPAFVSDFLTDTATLAGGKGPTGTITFNLFKGCPGSGTPIYTEVKTVTGNGTYTSEGHFYQLANVTFYSWQTSYSGDDNNNPTTTPPVCNGAESVMIPTLVAVSYTNGTGSGDHVSNYKWVPLRTDYLNPAYQQLLYDTRAAAHPNTISFPKMIHNWGGWVVDAAKGRFTAPQDGVYHVDTTICVWALTRGTPAVKYDIFVTQNGEDRNLLNAVQLPEGAWEYAPLTWLTGSTDTMLRHDDSLSIKLQIIPAKDGPYNFQICNGEGGEMGLAVSTIAIHLVN